MQYRKILYTLLSYRTGKEKSIDNTFAVGNWQFLQLGNYSLATPLVINQGSTSKLTFNQSDIVYQAGDSLSLNYDYIAQKFSPQQLNDVFLVEVRFKTKCSKQNGHADLLLESPSATFNPIQASTFGVPKSANVEQFISMAVPVFVGQEVKDNGLEVKVKAVDGNFSIYDVSFMVVRLSSGITP